jgi:hypothetical protein
MARHHDFAREPTTSGFCAKFSNGVHCRYLNGRIFTQFLHDSNDAGHGVSQAKQKLRRFQRLFPQEWATFEAPELNKSWPNPFVPQSTLINVVTE